MDTASILLSSPTIGDIEGDEQQGNSRRAPIKNPPDYGAFDSYHRQAGRTNLLGGITDEYEDQSRIHAATMAEIDNALRISSGMLHNDYPACGVHAVSHTLPHSETAITTNDAQYNESAASCFYQSGYTTHHHQQQQRSTTQPSTDASCWGDWDVPLGRSQKVREHSGNVRYREMVERYRPAYLAAEKRTDKTAISQRIYSAIKSMGGRFLDKKKAGKKATNVDNGGVQSSHTTVFEWYEIPEEKAIAKVSQALRLGVAGPGNSSLQVKSSYDVSSCDEFMNDIQGEQHRYLNLPSPMQQTSTLAATSTSKEGVPRRRTWHSSPGYSSVKSRRASMRTNEVFGAPRRPITATQNKQVEQTTDISLPPNLLQDDGSNEGGLEKGARRMKEDHETEAQNVERKDGQESCPGSLAYHNHQDDESFSYAIDFSIIDIDPTPVPCVAQPMTNLKGSNETGNKFQSAGPAKR